MNNKNIGELISSLRKAKGMTQYDLAVKMNITDKAVSKWERNLSYPDISSISKLSEILGVTVEELLNAKVKSNNNKYNKIINIALLGISLAMGISVLVTNILNKIDIKSSVMMLSLCSTCIAIYLLKNN